MNLKVIPLISACLLAFGFTYEPAGDLIPGSGTGQPNSPLQIVDMRFPIEVAPAYPNSQVYRPGGLHGGGGGQCDASNYSYPWQDNFCETRDYDVDLCPSGKGHQGQDIRPSTCADDTHWAVATESGTITFIGSHSVWLLGASGIRHRFLHMTMSALAVSVGQNVSPGQRLGRVSNTTGGTYSTTIHLHYDMYKYVAGVGSTYVSPYSTLVDSYENLLGYSGIESPGSGTCTPTPDSNALGNRFEDVVTGSTGEAHIYALADAGITNGCGTDLFCPDCDVERYQMAVFIARAAGLDLTNPPSSPTFNDVDANDWFYPHVEAVKAAGIVSGTTATTFSPHDSLTRKQASKFVILGAGIPIDTSDGPSFDDVPVSTGYPYIYIETMKKFCITEGCTATTFCPDTVVTRRIAAIFIARAFDLNPPQGYSDFNTCVNYCDVSTCDDGSFCDDYGDCGGFSDVCDETGQESRLCHDFECLGTYTNGTCDYSTSTQSQSCTRDTDGDVYSGFTPWSDCEVLVVNEDCSGDGEKTRSREVCSGGVPVDDIRTQACVVDPVDSSLLAIYQERWYADSDSDGVGDENDPGVLLCADPGDGSVLTNTDCDDDPSTGGSIYPGATEVCDGVDNDCDGLVDDLDSPISGQSTWYSDSDGDSYGDAAVTMDACVQPTNYVSDSTDCDDEDINNYPGNTEVCDGTDNDCDDLIDTLDPSLTGLATWYLDSDDDAHGDPSLTVDACDQPTGYVTDNNDCDDDDDTVYLDAPEICDGQDNDCDTLIDDLDTDITGQTTWYADADEDTYGNSTQAMDACDQPTGYVTDNTDCDDEDDIVYLGAPEICDAQDNDCDTLVDDLDPEITGQTTWYLDSDEDSDGDSSQTLTACDQPTGYVITATDCDDDDDTVYLNAPEICDGQDNDCDTLVDDLDSDATGLLTWYPDSDEDSYGDSSQGLDACDQPTGYVADDTDCDDDDETIYANATEVCDGVDNDCDTLVDDLDPEITGQLAWYLDADKDQAGDANHPVDACERPGLYVADDTDCDDDDDAINPSASEICDDKDNDCDTLVDDLDPSITGQPAWYPDSDGDAAGDASQALDACEQPAGYITDGTDCDDADATEYPGVTWYADSDSDTFGDPDSSNTCERANSTDVLDSTDCDDADATEYPGVTWYVDSDSDTFGDPDSSNTCERANSTDVFDSTDCDDSDAAEYPGVTWYPDSDSDTFGDPAWSAACERANSTDVLDNTDCDDNQATVYPSAPEICDGLDNDCDTLVDDKDSDIEGQASWYYDTDSDNYGDANDVQTTCVRPAGYVADDTDCDDNQATVYPSAPEICDGLDNDCDTLVDDDDSDIEGQSNWYFDNDADDFGDDNAFVTTCVQPAGYVADNTDCDDDQATVYPQAPEICDGLDNDCDSLLDDLDPDITGLSVWYIDSDEDGFGDASEVLEQCFQPTGYVSDNTDCDGEDPDINPAAAELCNAVDDNCDDVIDEGFDTDADGFTTCGGDCDDEAADVYPTAPEECDSVDNDCDDEIDEGCDSGLDIVDDEDPKAVEGCSSCSATGLGSASYISWLLVLFAGARRKPREGT
jgi:hypothetical protein